MRITYKLVVCKDGVETEEEFENNEEMVAKAKTYDPTYVPEVPVEKPSLIKSFLNRIKVKVE